MKLKQTDGAAKPRSRFQPSERQQGLNRAGEAPRIRNPDQYFGFRKKGTAWRLDTGGPGQAVSGAPTPLKHEQHAMRMRPLGSSLPFGRAKPQRNAPGDAPEGAAKTQASAGASGLLPLVNKADASLPPRGGSPTIASSSAPQGNRKRSASEEIQADPAPSTSALPPAPASHAGKVWHRPELLKKMKLPKAILHPPRTLAQLDLDLSQATLIEDLSAKRAVFQVEVNDRPYIIKFEVSADELALTAAARKFGVHAPQIVQLTDKQRGDMRSLVQKNTRAKRGGVIMEFVAGQPLAFLAGNLAAPAKRPLFSRAMLNDIGRSFAFQVLTGSADRWPMPVSVGQVTMTQGNSDNVFVDLQQGRVHDIDFTPGTVVSRQYAQDVMANCIQPLMTDATGGPPVDDICEFIGRSYNANTTIPIKDRVHIKNGFAELMASAASVLEQGPLGLSEEVTRRVHEVAEQFEAGFGTGAAVRKG